jgi:tryptophan synthase beta chain
MSERTTFNLEPDQIPTAWFNIMPRIVGGRDPAVASLHPGTKEPVTPDLLAPLFPKR